MVELAVAAADAVAVPAAVSGVGELTTRHPGVSE
jgi:hypothetical protein